MVGDSSIVVAMMIGDSEWDEKAAEAAGTAPPP
jgi:phosphoglycolate phosphatase-like HAD superfamily hydrolase